MATLNDFTSKTGSNNLVVELPKEEREKIIFGADCQYTFKFDLELSDIDTAFFIFNQGSVVYKTKTSAVGGGVTLAEVTESGHTYLTVASFLSAQETSELGKLPYLTNSIQVKFKMSNTNDIVYGKYVVLDNVQTLDN